MVAFRAFVDDSQAGTGDKRLFLAAFVNDVDTWIDFTTRWDDELHDEPAIDYFRMSEATSWKTDGPFRGWTDEARWKKIYALADVIKQFCPWAFHISMSVTEFDRILRPKLPYPLQTKYTALCLNMISGLSHLHLRLGLTEPLSFVFDDGPGIASKVVPIFDFVMHLPEEADRKRLVSGTPAFEDDKELAPLQAADMLAWLVRRSHEGNLLPEHYALGRKIIRPERHWFVALTARDLQELADLFDEQPDIEIGRTKKEWAEHYRKLSEEFERRHGRPPLDK